ncbi:MYG1 family protein [Candidatus Saccharibacteria bacterium]|nr:MYG1 family protein [Candidatus Saccharibacteria bacterium]
MTKAVTHSGTFHADDVFASVVLQKIFPDLKITRTRDEKTIAKADIAFDVGGIYDPVKLRFDHHQVNAPKRSNGIGYASFGLVWKEFGEQYCGSKTIADRIDQVLAIPIDTADIGVPIVQTTINGVEPFMVDKIIFQLNPTALVGHEKGTSDQCFLEAIDLAKQILDRQIIKLQDEQAIQEYLAGKIAEAQDKRYIVLDKSIQLKGIPINAPELLYVIYPDAIDGTWGVRAINKPGAEFEVKRPFPKAWAGLAGEKLAKASGVTDAVFAHKAGFLAIAQTQAGAIALVKKVLAS